MHPTDWMCASLLATLVTQVFGAAVIKITTQYSLEEQDIFPLATYQLRCPLLRKYAPCKTSCTCSAAGTVNCGSSAPSICYEEPKGYMGRYPCICFNAEVLEISDDSYEATPAITENPVEEPATSVTTESVWPSMLNCPKNMPLDIKQICWQKCSCVKATGKVCLDDAPADCRTKCICSESAYMELQAREWQTGSLIENENQQILSQDSEDASSLVIATHYKGIISILSKPTAETKAMFLNFIRQYLTNKRYFVTFNTQGNKVEVNLDPTIPSILNMELSTQAGVPKKVMTDWQDCLNAAAADKTFSSVKFSNEGVEEVK